MDIIFDNISKEWIIFQFIIISFIVFPFIFSLRVKTQNQSFVYSKRLLSKNSIILLLVIFCIFASYDGDYWSYLCDFKQLSRYIDSYTNFEEVYLYIIKYRLVDSYIYFRLVVWGGGLLFYYLSFSRLGINTSLVWILFTITTLLSVAYIRGFLGMGLALYGYSYLIKPLNNRVYSYLLGFIIMCLSLFMHKSMFIIIGCGFLSLFFNKKWVLIFSIILFPILCIALKTLAIMILDTEMVGLNYLESDSGSNGIGIKIYERLRLLVVLICIGNLFVKFFRDNLPKYISYSLYLVYFIVYIYFLFYFVFERNGIGGQYLCDRIFVMLFTVFPIIYEYFFKNIRNSVWIIISLLIATIAYNYRLVYSYYLQSMEMGINLI